MLLAAVATPTPMAVPRTPPPPPPAIARPPITEAPHLPPPGAARRPAVKKRATPRPAPRPTPTPRWRPPAGTVYVDGSGVYPAAPRLRWGRPLRFIQPGGVKAPLSLVAVDPHRIVTGEARALAAFPATLTTTTRWAWLGDADGLKHRHWTIATGTALTVMPDTFLALQDEINGAGTQWPLRQLLYVVVGERWRKVVVTIDR